MRINISKDYDFFLFSEIGDSNCIRNEILLHIHLSIIFDYINRKSFVIHCERKQGNKLTIRYRRKCMINLSMRTLELVQPFFTLFEFWDFFMVFPLGGKEIKNLNIWMRYKMVVLVLGYALIYLASSQLRSVITDF